MGKKKSYSFPLYLQILLGMVAGIVIGIIALQADEITFVQHWVRPWGQLFIRLLQLIAIPLVFTSLVKGVADLNDISRFSRIGGRTIAIYIGTTAIAVILGLSMGLLVKPGKLVKSDQIVLMQESYQAVASEKKLAAEQTTSQGPLAFLNDIVPSNILSAGSDNSKMLQIIFFAIFFGIAILALPAEKVRPVVKVISGLNDIVLKMVEYIIRIAPYGVAALMAGLVTDFKGNLSLFSALAVYALTVAACLFILLLFFYPALVRLFAGGKVKDFMRSMLPVQLFAFSTSSSSATLPVTMETVEHKLGVSREVSSFVLPLGATVNMDGTSCYQAIAILFIAQVLGLELTFQQLLIVLLMTILSSIGTPGIPGGSYVVLAMVLTSVGIPPEGLALILGIDRPLDMLRTSVNVTGDAAVAMIIDKSGRKSVHSPHTR